jgi:outer membrane protein
MVTSFPIRHLSYAFLLAAALLSPSRILPADDAKFPVAVLNVDKVFKLFAPLQERLAPLRQDAQDLEKTMQLKQVELETTQQKLQRTPAGSADFEKLQVQLARLQTELRLFVERERRNLAKKEAEIYVALFQEMEEEVKKIAKARGIKLVVRQNAGSPKDERVEEVLKWLNRPVIFDDGVDITDEVLAALNSRTKKD